MSFTAETGINGSMIRTKAAAAQRHRIEVGDQVFIVTKDAGQYSRFYVLDEAGEYLTPRGYETLAKAQLAATLLAGKLIS